jgi:hypothetical protein
MFRQSHQPRFDRPNICEAYKLWSSSLCRHEVIWIFKIESLWFLGSLMVLHEWGFCHHEH